MRSDSIEAFGPKSLADVFVKGGQFDAGTPASPGNNKFNLLSPKSDYIIDLSPNNVPAVGNRFEFKGKVTEKNFSIAKRMVDGVDKPGAGLVIFRANTVFVPRGKGSVQNALDAAPADYTIEVQAGVKTSNITVTKPVKIDFPRGVTVEFDDDLAFGPGTSTLRVTGGPTTQSIELDPVKKTKDVEVFVNGDSLGSYPPTGGIVVHGGTKSGDSITIDKGITLPALLFAGGANAQIQGGGGPTVEVGDGGNRTQLKGGTGRNVLIAGPGHALLEGTSNEDLIIAGTTDFDANEAALIAILNEWTTTYDANNAQNDFNQRKLDLETGIGVVDGVTIQLDSATVHSNDARNRIEGGGGLDLLFIVQSGKDADTVVQI